MAEKFYALIKDGYAYDVIVFNERNDELADKIALEQGYDDAVWCDETAPTRYSSYDGNTFTHPTNEFLIEIGVIDPIPPSVPEEIIEE